ncbi:MAG: Gram-negative bacterial tonB protein [Candidatus Scalindua rubra]|uniref:Gram-negative bacterial tonB protein n=1 Tax=Candidatus Scalindua rubra TaxID=1872076 RepID=A0A1E3XCP9_9BACT|nr:MAG: Gram-negative bacterial tonB protein [Candidatus Scalindua rubra]
MKIQVNYQILGFGSSFLFHLIFVPFVIYSTSIITQESKTIVLDFNLKNIVKTGEHHTDTKPIKTTEATEKKKQSTANDEKKTKKILGERIFDERTDKFETVPVSTIEEDGRKATATKNQKIKTIINEKPISTETAKETITVLPETHKHLEVKDNLNNNLTEEIRKNVHGTTYEIQEVTIENTQKPTAQHQIKNYSYSPPPPHHQPNLPPFYPLLHKKGN